MLSTRDLMNEGFRRPRGGADIVATYCGRASVKCRERSRGGSTFLFQPTHPTCTCCSLYWELLGTCSLW